MTYAQPLEAMAVWVWASLIVSQTPRFHHETSNDMATNQGRAPLRIQTHDRSQAISANQLHAFAASLGLTIWPRDPRGTLQAPNSIWLQFCRSVRSLIRFYWLGPFWLFCFSLPSLIPHGELCFGDIRMIFKLECTPISVNGRVESAYRVAWFWGMVPTALLSGQGVVVLCAGAAFAPKDSKVQWQDIAWCAQRLRPDWGSERRRRIFAEMKQAALLGSLKSWPQSLREALGLWGKCKYLQNYLPIHKNLRS